MTSPNIIYILADDLGYGDVGCNNADSRIPTPHLDRLAGQGMRFTDAHAGSSVCTPSRYNILTGCYGWRSRLKQGIVWWWDAPLIGPEQRTVAHLLREQGYHTACLGKWHLGWNWPMKNGGHPNDFVTFGLRDEARRRALDRRIDYEGRIEGGPVDRGFDTYFGVDVPNFPPYTWFENDRLVQVPSVEKPDHLYGCPGLAVPDWNLEETIPQLTHRAVELVASQAAARKPFFLYFPLTSPHSPIVPNEPFKGMSGAGRYGDFVCEVDWVVGQVCEALERTGQVDDTLLIFTSDNGPEERTRDEIGAYQRVREHGHQSMGDLRGIKCDAWEGGHRVPFIARWPGVTPAGATCDQLITLGDFMATCARITGARLHANDARDSVSILPLLQGQAVSVRECAVHHSHDGKFAVRRGNWVLIDSPCGGDRDEPDWWREARGYQDHDFPAELFHLGQDISERHNCYGSHPGIVSQLGQILGQVKGHGLNDQVRPADCLTE